MNISSVLNDVYKLKSGRTAANVSQLIEIKDHEIHFLDGSARVYKASPTLQALHENDSLVRLLMGPYRSGKSVGLCAEIIFRACAMPPCKDNVRRCRVAIVRNTYADLQDTVLNTWLDWYGNFGVIEHHKSPRIFYKHRFWDGKKFDGRQSMVELEILFLALDHEKDLRKLKSLEATVYPEYNDDLHSKDELEIMDHEPLMIGIDFGLYTPAAVIAQAWDGQIRILKEFVTHDLGIRELFERFVEPYLRKLNEKRPEGRKLPYTLIRDPAGRIAEVEDLMNLGFRSEPAPTNDLNPRLDAVKWHLGRIVSGVPALLLDRQGCPTLRDGFIGGYNYKRISTLSNEDFRPEPDKNFYSHCHDCVQYIALYSRGLEGRMDDGYEEYEVFDETTRNKVTGY